MADYTLSKTGPQINALHAQQDWMFGRYDNGNQSGALTLDPSNGATQKSTITGNITGVTCGLSTTYPYMIWDITTSGNGYTFDATGFVTDGGDSITLPNAGKARLLFSLDINGVTKQLYLVATNMA